MTLIVMESCLGHAHMMVFPLKCLGILYRLNIQEEIKVVFDVGFCLNISMETSSYTNVPYGLYYLVLHVFQPLT